MTDAAAAKTFVEKWAHNTQKESSASKEHFVDLCHLLGQTTPNDLGSGPNTYCFEKSLTKVGGSAGFADVWRRDRFAWEYKTKGKYPDLRTAYQQLLLYREDLDNPPMTISSAFSTQNYTNSGHMEWGHNYAKLKVASATRPQPPSRPSPSPGGLDTSHTTIRVSKRSARRRASWCGSAASGWLVPSPPAPLPGRERGRG